MLIKLGGNVPGLQGIYNLGKLIQLRCMEQNVSSNMQDCYLWSRPSMTHSQIVTVGPLDSSPSIPVCSITTTRLCYFPNVQSWTSHLLVGKIYNGFPMPTKNFPLGIQGLQPPSKFSSSPVFQSTAKKTVLYHYSFFPNVAWPFCLHGLLSFVYNTLPAFTCFSLTLL